MLNWNIQLSDCASDKGSVLLRQFRDVRASEVSGGKCLGKRDSSHTMRDGAGFIGIVCKLDGSETCREKSQEVTCRSGDVTIWSNRSELEFEVHDWSRNFILIVPASRFDAAQNEALTRSSLFLSHESALGRLSGEFLTSLAGSLPELDREEGQTAISMAVDMIANVIQGAAETGSKIKSTTLYTRVLAFIERHLGDPDLSPKAIAEAHGISLRSLQLLFERNERTIGSHILQQRLLRSRTEIENANIRRSLSEISYDLGFSDPAYFSRSFKKWFGVTPGSLRSAKADMIG